MPGPLVNGSIDPDLRSVTDRRERADHRGERAMMGSDATEKPAAACAQCGGEPTPTEPGQAVNADAAEVITHCEWCGAEYPVPSGD